MTGLRKSARTTTAVCAGWLLGFFCGSPGEVIGQTRISLASLQASINNIISGATQVGSAAEADDALTLDGFAASDFVLVSSPVKLTAVSAPANPSNAGTLRWNSSTGKAEVSTGISWEPLH